MSEVDNVSEIVQPQSKWQIIWRGYSGPEDLWSPRSDDDLDGISPFTHEDRVVANFEMVKF